MLKDFVTKRVSVKQHTLLGTKIEP